MSYEVFFGGQKIGNAVGFEGESSMKEYSVSNSIYGEVLLPAATPKEAAESYARRYGGEGLKEVKVHERGSAYRLRYRIEWTGSPEVECNPVGSTGFGGGEKRFKVRSKAGVWSLSPAESDGRSKYSVAEEYAKKNPLHLPLESQEDRLTVIEETEFEVKRTRTPVATLDDPYARFRKEAKAAAEAAIRDLKKKIIDGSLPSKKSTLGQPLYQPPSIYDEIKPGDVVILKNGIVGVVESCGERYRILSDDYCEVLCDGDRIALVDKEETARRQRVVFEQLRAKKRT